MSQKNIPVFVYGQGAINKYNGPTIANITPCPPATMIRFTYDKLRDPVII